MSESRIKKNVSKSNGQDCQPLDRQDFFKNIRNDFLCKIGLPPDTKPGQVMRILEIKKELDRINQLKKH
ncbi:MAG: hypothetical protein LBJ61_03420 [Deltaproteobacteria bacterium]|nr:hypothetical protein [Deltaproteobacteria bacterium]